MIDREIKVPRFKRKLPIDIDYDEIVYVEPSYDHAINTFIESNLGRLSDMFRAVGRDFCYLPAIVSEINSKEYIDYYTPYDTTPKPDGIDSGFIFQYLCDDELDSPALLFWDKVKRKINPRLKALEIHDFNLGPGDVFDSLAGYLKTHQWHEDAVMCCTTDLIDDYLIYDTAEIGFDHEAQEIMDDVRPKIDRLRQHGIREEVLQSLLKPRQVLSRMQIGEGGRITLPGYGNREIKMTPLVKATYLLFLNHPEGIMFKELPGYRQELMTIYSHLTNRSSQEDVRQSMADVTDPTKNSINEKCARIREAFLGEFDERLASYYFVTGLRGQPKQITLPRHLIDWHWQAYPRRD